MAQGTLGILDTKNRLIDTAIDLITRNSYLSVGVSEICRKAGVQKGSFYHFFPSKVDLAIAAMEKHYQNIHIEVERIFSLDKPPLQRFQDLADHIIQKQKAMLQEYGRVCGCPFAMLGADMAGQEDLISKKVHEIFSRFEKYYERAICDAIEHKELSKNIDSAAKAQELYTYILGQVIMARIQNSLHLLERDLKRGIFLILGAPLK